MSAKGDYVSVEKDEFEGLTTIEHVRHCRHRGGRMNSPCPGVAIFANPQTA